MPLSDPWPDLRHVRYVMLSAHVPGSTTADLGLGSRVFRNALVGASAGGSIAMHVSGHVFAGLVLGGALGAASGLFTTGRAPPRGFALVPWGVILDGDEQVSAIRWSGVHELDINYRASRDGTVRTRVEIASIRGSFVGWASDAVDFGALAGKLHEVAAASSRPIAVDLDGAGRACDGEPFVERVLDSARRLVQLEGESRLGLEARTYRETHGPSSEGDRTARALRAIGVASATDADPWALIAAIAGELRLDAFLPELSRLSNAPHPGVAALARAAVGRVRKAIALKDDDAPALDTDEGEALSWFVEPDELARLRMWRDA
jgi:hypothetical protein